MIEHPEFNTKNLSLLSPLPIHPSEPSQIPVLRNQDDQIFNMTSTHTEPPRAASPSDFSSNLLDAVSAGIEDGSPSAESSFSDAYKEQTDVTAEQTKTETVEEAGEDEGSDDYDMTFDSDGEEGSDSRIISQANVQQDTNALPASVPTTQPSPLAHESTIVDTTSAQSNSPPTHPQATDSSAEQVAQSSSTQVAAEPVQQHSHTYEDIASGEVDIQALLDNITANAEKNEAASAISTPTSANPSNSLHKSISSLPLHASLPPRPQVAVPSYPYDDSSKNRAAPTSFSKPSNTYVPPPGVTIPFIASAGAPGTSTDTRGGMYAPPVPSYGQSHVTPSPISPGVPPYANSTRAASYDRPTQSIEAQDDREDANIKWAPDVQKKYDIFLTEERNYVTEGQWDRFPAGSRLFIGKQMFDSPGIWHI